MAANNTAEKKPGSMVIHLDEADMIRHLTDRDRGRLFLALVDYAQSGVQPVGFKGVLALCYEQMSRSVDRNVERYRKTCERNAVKANKRWHPDVALADDYDRIHSDTNEYDRMHSDTNEYDRIRSDTSEYDRISSYPRAFPDDFYERRDQRIRDAFLHDTTP